MKRAALLLLVLALPVQAGPLAEALEFAWARHPQAAALGARQDEARARAELAAALTPGPAAVTFAHRNDALGSGRGQQEWEAELAAPLWLPGQKAAQAAEAQALGAGLEAEARALRLQLAGELREAWWNLARARTQRDLAARRAATAQALEADVERRHRAGDLARVDANLARNERLVAQAEALESAAATTQAEQVWRALTGLPPPVSLIAEAPAAASEHPQTLALQAAARLAHARLRTAQESRRDAPELALRWMRERSDSADPFGHSVGVKFTLPLTSEPRQRRDQSAARAEALQLDAEAARTRETLEQEAKTARRQLEAAEQRLSLTRERQPLIADNLALAEKAFGLGEADLAHLLRNRAAALEAEAALARQSLERDAAVSRLLQTLGVMP